MPRPSMITEVGVPVGAGLGPMLRPTAETPKGAVERLSEICVE